MIVITGATGALNGATVDHLVTRIPLDQIIVAVRDPAKAQRFHDMGIAVRVGDYADPASLPGAFAGADQLLMVSSNSNDPKVDPVDLHRAAIDAAVTAGVGRILYTSHQGAGLGSPFRPAHNHARTENLLADSGLKWTSLRNGFYAHALLRALGPWRETGVISVPVDGPISWTAREDAAEAAAVIVASDGGFDGIVTLTAAAAHTFADVAEITSDITEREVRFEVTDDDTWVAAQIEAGVPEFLARFSLGIYQAAGEGRFTGTDPLLEELLEREPQTVRELLQRSEA